MQTSREVYSHSDWQIRARLYEYWPSGTVAVRTAQETRMFERIGEARGITVFGIKGENVFHQLVDISDNLTIDWMHCVCKGILKRQLFKPWFNPQYSTESNSLLGISHELDNMFPSIKVPHDFTRKPCSIAEFNTEKHQNFICLPSLLDCHVFNLLYFLYYHFALYCSSFPALEEVQVLLDNFVKLLPSLYGIEECTYNSHA